MADQGLTRCIDFITCLEKARALSNRASFGCPLLLSSFAHLRSLASGNRDMISLTDLASSPWQLKREHKIELNYAYNLIGPDYNNEAIIGIRGKCWGQRYGREDLI